MYKRQGLGITVTDNTDSITIASTVSGGTLTDFSSGNLSPLFTTSVTNSTTTPALSFSLSNAAAYTNFGNNTSGSSPPTFFANNFTDSLIRSNDSIFRRVNGSFYFQYKLPTSYSGTVTNFSGVTNQGVNWGVTNPTTTPQATLTLGALTGVTSLNGMVVTANTGAITTGIWNATPITTTYGGTGLTSWTQGDVPYYISGTALSKKAIGTANQLFRVNAGATAPEWFTPTYLLPADTVSKWMRNVYKKVGTDSIFKTIGGVDYFVFRVDSTGVTNFSFTNGNGFAGTVTNPTTTPTLSLATTFTGLAYSNGSGLGAEIVGTGLTENLGTLTWNGVNVRKSGIAPSFTERGLNFIPGANVTLTLGDDPGNNRVNVTIASSGGGGGGGSVDSVSTTDLTPLFTTAVTNPTTIPNIAFTLSSTAATYKVFGSPTIGVPSFISLDTNYIALFSTQVRPLFSVTTIGTSGPSTYDNLTGITNIPQYAGTVTNVTATLPLSVTNGTTTPNISMTKASTTDSGWVSTGTQSFAGVKTHTGNQLMSAARFELTAGANCSRRK